MKRQVWHKLKVLAVVLAFILPHILSVLLAENSVAAEEKNVVEMVSAQIVRDGSGKRALELEVAVDNRHQTIYEQEIEISGNNLRDSDAWQEQEGISYLVSDSKICLQVSPNTAQTLKLLFQADEEKWQEDARLVLTANQQQIVAEDETLGDGETGSSGTLDESSGKEPEQTDQSASDITDDSTAEIEGEAVYHPFAGPVLTTRSAKLLNGHTPIMPQYSKDDKGTYPTAAWQPDGQNNVINHQGNVKGSNQWDGIEAWDGQSNNRQTSYIEYGGSGDQADYAIRKYARETGTQGLFDVYLNVRGNYQKDIQPLDIVLVVDWSGSMMNEGRIGYARDGVSQFVDTLKESGMTKNINLGYVGYSSEGYSNGSVSLGPFDAVADRIKRITPGRVSGGTFTQKAMRNAADMLSTANGHKKIMVLLTDGVPTFSYGVTRVNDDYRGNIYGTAFDLGWIDWPGDTSKFTGYFVRNQEGRNSLVDSTFVATIGEAKGIISKGIEVHGLGIQLTGDDKAGLSKRQVEDKMKQMVSSDEHGKLYYESVDKASDIVDYLTSKAVEITGTVANGVIKDPISTSFSYVPGSLSYKSFGNQVVQPVYGESNGVITATDIDLVKDQEVQFHYQVRLKTEGNDFQPGYWYQLNDKTTFQPTGASGETVEFGVPSARAPGVQLDLRKKWEEFDGDRSSRPDAVTFKITRKKTTDQHAWQSGFSRIDKPADDTTDTWERLAVDKLSLASGKEYSETLYLPKFNNTGEDFDYQVSSEIAVDGYKSKVADNVVTNTKEFKPYSLLIKKVSSPGSHLLKGAKFQLTGGGKSAVLTDNGDGTYSLPADTFLQKDMAYTLTEVAAPAGHTLPEKKEWQIVVGKDGKVTIDGKEATVKNQQVELTVQNDFTKVPIAVWKYYETTDKQQKPLADATFELQKQDQTDKYIKVSEGTSDDHGLARFVLLASGHYRIVETKGPKGFDTRPGNYEFTVDTYGGIIYTGDNIKKDSSVWTLTHQNDLKPFDLIVNKLDDDNQALKGAKFKLTGPGLGSGIELPADTGEPLDTFRFDNLQPGTYELTETETPEGYRGLEKSVAIIIHDNGKVTVDGEEYSDLLVAGQENNVLQLDVTNYAKVRLPETGGGGRIPFYVIGVLSLTVAAGYLITRFSYKKEVG